MINLNNFTKKLRCKYYDIERKKKKPFRDTIYTHVDQYWDMFEYFIELYA